MGIYSAVKRVAAKAKALVGLHVEKRTLHDYVIDPDHAERNESALFRQTKERLKKDGHYKCFVCGGTENLQVHHLACEWMFANVVNYAKLQNVLQAFDPYGYSTKITNPITSVDDVRNMLVLCQPHHTGVDHKDGSGGTGIHALTMPSWIAQAVCNTSPVPMKGETFAQAKARIKSYEREA